MLTQRTPRQFADLIETRINLGGVSIVMQKNPIFGWCPQVVASAPGQTMAACQQMADKIAAELRQTYELRS